MDRAQEWLADYTRRVGDIQRRAEQTQEQIKSLRARAASPDGSVSVVLAPGGRLEELRLSPRALELGHQRLAATITQTVQAAHAEAAAQTQEALLPLVGESDAMDFLRDQIGAAMDEEEDDQSPAASGTAEERTRGGRARARDDDDDEPFGGSILR